MERCPEAGARPGLTCAMRAGAARVRRGARRACGSADPGPSRDEPSAVRWRRAWWPPPSIASWRRSAHRSAGPVRTHVARAKPRAFGKARGSRRRYRCRRHWRTRLGARGKARAAWGRSSPVAQHLAPVAAARPRDGAKHEQRARRETGSSASAVVAPSRKDAPPDLRAPTRDRACRRARAFSWCSARGRRRRARAGLLGQPSRLRASAGSEHRRSRRGLEPAEHAGRLKRPEHDPLHPRPHRVAYRRHKTMCNWTASRQPYHPRPASGFQLSPLLSPCCSTSTTRWSEGAALVSINQRRGTGVAGLARANWLEKCRAWQ
jgi:hypothetical protein